MNRSSPYPPVNQGAAGPSTGFAEQPAGTDSGLVAIGARFGFGAAVGEGAADTVAAAASGLVRCVRRPVIPFNLPPNILTGTSVGSYLDQPYQFGPQPGYYWDITLLSVLGFSAGAVAVSKNAPLVTAAGNPYGIEAVWTFTAAGSNPFPQKGNPLLSYGERLVFTVTSALTGYAAVSGMVVQVPAERLDEYLS